MTEAEKVEMRAFIAALKAGTEPEATEAEIVCWLQYQLRLAKRLIRKQGPTTENIARYLDVMRRLVIRKIPLEGTTP